jgi:DNA-directed RNA polymerase subunit K/omega
MIENGSPLMLPDTKEIKAIKIAMEETDAGLNPIIIRRTLPNGNIEEWKNSELFPTKNFI